MKFPRRNRLHRNPFDAAAYAAVFFLLVIFVALSTRLYTPGVRIQLPAATTVSTSDHPTLTVALDEHGQLYFQNQIIGAAELGSQLRAAVTAATTPLSLVVYMDKSARLEPFVQLQQLARDAGLAEVLLATAQR